MANNNAERLLLPREAAQYLGLTLATVYSKTSRRELPSIRVGGALRFRRSDLERLIARGFRPALPRPTRRQRGRQ